MRIVFFVSLSSLLFAQNLQTLLVYAKEHNALITSTKLQAKSKAKELGSAEKSYYPTLDISGFYKRDDKPSPMQPGTVYGGGGAVGWDVYKGGRRSYTKKALQEEYLAKKHTSYATQKDISLDIVKTFFSIKTLQAQKKAQEDAKKAIHAQLERMRGFYEAKLATEDMLLRLQSAYDKSDYTIASLKFEIYSQKKALSLLVGKKVDILEDSSFKKPDAPGAETLDAIKALKYTKTSLLYKARLISSSYYPTITLKDTFMLYGYDDKPAVNIPGMGQIPIELLKKQNRLEANIYFRLFDFGVLKEQKEALMLEANALAEKIAYRQKEQQMQIALSKERIKTTYMQLKSAKSALKASQSAFKIVEEKYTNGIVDNITYLDALKTKTQAHSAYEKAKNDIEIAYGIYYYYLSKNLEEELQ